VRRVVAAIAVIFGACASPVTPRADVTTTMAPTTTLPATTSTLDASAARSTALQQAVDSYAAAQPVPFNVVVEDIASGVHASRGADRVVLSASLYKLFVARELLRRIAEGRLARSAPANDGAGHTVGQCLQLMITISDNACGLAGLRMVGGGALDAGLTADGYPATRLESPQRTSAHDIALFLLRARDGTLLGPGRDQEAHELYGLLQAQQINDRLPKGLPPGTPIAHKTGDRIGWAHDAGIIAGPRGDFLLVVLTGEWHNGCCDADRNNATDLQGFAAIAGLGRIVYNTLAA